MAKTSKPKVPQMNPGMKPAAGKPLPKKKSSTQKMNSKKVGYKK